MVQQDGTPGTQSKFFKKTVWSIDRLKDTFTQTEKFGDTEECQRRRDVFRQEVEEEVLAKCGVDEGKAGGYKCRRDVPQWIIRE